MKLSKKYIPLISPIQKPFVDFTKKEAQEYFVWFLDNIDDRCNYLISKVSDGLKIPIDRIDYSVESLKIIWKWFLGIAEISKKSHVLLDKAQPLKNYSFLRDFLNKDAFELSVFTQYVIRDIGMYLGKVLKTNYPILEWTFKTKPKNYVSVNEPLLIGFVDDNPSYPKPFYPEFILCYINIITIFCICVSLVFFRQTSLK